MLAKDTVQVEKSKIVSPTGVAATAGTSDARDRMLHAMQARFTGSLSPASLTLAILDWELHIADAPGRRAVLGEAALHAWQTLLSPVHWIGPAANDHRFQDLVWSQPPFNLLEQAFLLAQDWWRGATAPLPGVTRRHTDIVAFTARQLLDIASPSNFAVTNPEVWRAFWAVGGWNFVQGAHHWLEDTSPATGLCSL